MNNAKSRSTHSDAVRLIACALALAVSGAGIAHDADKLGNVSFPVSCSAEAQQSFNRALAMLHSFWFPQSGNAFSEVAKADPGCAMAYWGMAISQRANPLVGAPTAAATKSGSELIEKAKAANAKTQRERDYIGALELYYKDWDKLGFSSRVLAYEKAMEQLSARYPEDIEAAALYALALNEGITVAPPDKTYARHLKAAAITEKVLAKQPDHPGALHYLIHSYDFPALATRGVPAASHYASVAPSAPHALHMPSHIYSMLGMWEESIESNRTALGVAKAFVHAMDFMAYAYLQLGQERQAERLMNESLALQKGGGSALTRSPTGAALTVHTAWAAMPARYAIERGAWKEAAALELRPSSPPADAITHFTRAMGYARLGELANARSEIDKLQGLRQELLGSQQEYWAEQVDIQRKAATAWVAYKEGKNKEALALMRSAADLEDASEKNVAMENRLWPMRELLGELLLELKEPALALREFEASLGEARNRLRGLYGAAKAATMANDRPKAGAYYQKLLALAAKADTDRPELAEARSFVTGQMK